MTLPASRFVNVIPSVLAAGAPPLSMSGLILTEDASIPIGTVQSFPSAAAVATWFGPGSNQAYLAGIYFNGYAGCTQLPGNLLFAQYNASAVPAYVRGVLDTPLTVAQVTALSGTITITCNGTPYTTGTINLSSAVSFSTAAGLIQTGLTTAGAAVTCTYDAIRNCFVIATTGTGTGATIAYPTDSSLSPALYLQAVQGATISQGAAAATPAGTMGSVTSQTENWAAFMTDWLPSSTVMGQFASWVTTQNDQFLYVGYDDNAAPESGSSPSSFGASTSSYNGVCAVWNPAGDKAAFILGSIASINFQQPGGRRNFKYISQAGLTPDVTSDAVYANLLINSYNAYVSVGNGTQLPSFLGEGTVSGSWKWLDSYVNQIYFNQAIQGALLTLLTNASFIPYNTQGFGLVRAAMQDVIQQMLSFGAANKGVAISSSQAAEVNAATGVNAAQSLQNYGYYLQIQAPSPSVQQARGSPIINLWYVDGESINQITVGSIDLE